jgi:hypothetical protein
LEVRLSWLAGTPRHGSRFLFRQLKAENSIRSSPETHFQCIAEGVGQQTSRPQLSKGQFNTQGFTSAKTGNKVVSVFRMRIGCTFW